MAINVHKIKDKNKKRKKKKTTKKRKIIITIMIIMTINYKSWSGKIIIEKEWSKKIK